jgi:hypothetical protein
MAGGNRSGMTRSIKLGVAACAAVVALAVAGPAQAAPVSWLASGVECSSIMGTGLTTHLPDVYAYNTRRYVRERQKVGIQLSIDKHTGSAWQEIGITEWYYAYAWDNFSAKAWISSAGRGTQLAHENFLWQLPGPGVYRVYIRFWHGPTPTMSAYRSGWKIFRHHGGYDDNGNGFPDYCLMTST